MNRWLSIERSMGRWCGRLALAGACLAAAAGEPERLPTYQALADGSSAAHPGDKLVWLRCVEGMRWDGARCSGEPVLLTHAEAVAWAATVAKAEGLPWRLPHAAEMRRLARDLARDLAHQDSAKSFPGSRPGWHWTRTASIDTKKLNQYDYTNIAKGRTGGTQTDLNHQRGWAVDTGTGQARGDVGRATKLMVRLVRQAP